MVMVGMVDCLSGARRWRECQARAGFAGSFLRLLLLIVRREILKWCALSYPDLAPYKRPNAGQLSRQAIIVHGLRS